MFESRKRAREEDDLDWQPQLHDHKRPRALPFRTSPNSKYINTFSQSPRTLPTPLLTPALTPTETSEDEGEVKNPFRSPARERSAQLTLSSTITIKEARDFDMDLDDFQSTETPRPWRSVESAQPSPCTIVPRTLSYNPQEINHGGRIPTPIYGHFSHAERSMDLDTADDQIPQSQQEIAHDLFLRRRRLPSPISEDEAMDAPDGMGGMLGRLEMGPRNTLQSPFKTNKMWGGGSGVTKGKMTISMGFRADCEKCRMKVPGHYNHLIRT
ncbi:MAG: hypothetical protein LQ345_002682 [Seirophora villosa]|nr:MAG: hypothetical protein LQ345_002682 [Seirophora villosa]